MVRRAFISQWVYNKHGGAAHATPMAAAADNEWTWNWHAPHATYAAVLARALQLPPQDAALGVAALENALAAATPPAWRVPSPAMVLEGGQDSHSQDSQRLAGGEDSAEGENMTALRAALDASTLLPRLGGVRLTDALLYRGPPQCQAQCREEDVATGTCATDQFLKQCSLPAAERVTLADDSALRAELVRGAQPDAATGAFFLCAKHADRLRASSSGAQGLVATALAGATMLALGPLAALGVGATALASMAVLRNRAWRAVRATLHDPLAPSRDAVLRAVATPRGGGDLLLRMQTEALAAPTDAPEAPPIDVLREVAAGATLRPAADPVARASGMTAAVATLRDLVPSLRTVPGSLVAAAINAGVNAAARWRELAARVPAAAAALGVSVPSALELLAVVDGPDARIRFSAEARKRAIYAVGKAPPACDDAVMDAVIDAAEREWYVALVGGNLRAAAAGMTSMAPLETRMALLRMALLPSNAPAKTRIAQLRSESGADFASVLLTAKNVVAAIAANVVAAVAAATPPCAHTAAIVDALQPRDTDWTPQMMKAEAAAAAAADNDAARQRALVRALIDGPHAATAAQLHSLLVTDAPLQALQRLDVARVVATAYTTTDTTITDTDAYKAAESAVTAAAALYVRDAVAAGVEPPSHATPLPPLPRGLDAAALLIDAATVLEEGAVAAPAAYAAALVLAQVALARMSGYVPPATMALPPPEPLPSTVREAPSATAAAWAATATTLTDLGQWRRLYDQDPAAYVAALPRLAVTAHAAFRNNVSAGALDAARTAAFLGLAPDDLLDARRLRARVIPLLALLDVVVTPHRGVVELLRANITMFLAYLEANTTSDVAAAAHALIVEVDAV